MAKYYVQTAFQVYEIDVDKKEDIEKEVNGEDIELIVPVEGHHICRYCYSVAEGDYEDLLCTDCRETFGHSLYCEL